MQCGRRLQCRRANDVDSLGTRDRRTLIGCARTRTDGSPTFAAQAPMCARTTAARLPWVIRHHRVAKLFDRKERLNVEYRRSVVPLKTAAAAARRRVAVDSRTGDLVVVRPALG